MEALQEKKQKNRQSKKPIRILLVDDDAATIEVLRMRLEDFYGFEVIGVNNPKEALAIFSDRSDIDILITDQKMAEMSGQELMQECLSIDPDLQTIIFTAYGTIDQAVESMKLGAYTYLTKPVDHEALSATIEKAMEKRMLLRRIQDLEGLLEGGYRFSRMIGKSPRMQAIFRQILQLAPTDSTISIYGESGTGKELVANAIHTYSRRSKANFVAVNCAAIPETLLEDELFGHVKGAYTNAVRHKEGLFLQAHKGTLFLDEVGEMSEAMQAKLLRVIETGEVRPLGSDVVKKVDVRLVVATKRDLKELVDKGRFREDLYYRIHVVPVKLPPLRERQEDIILLLYHFLNKYTKKMDKPIKGVEEAVVERFKSYHWPGNVRELENTVEYLVAICTTDVLGEELLEHTPLNQVAQPDKIPPLREAKDKFIKEYLHDLFRLTQGNISQAARLAGYYRADFYKLFQKYQMDPKEYKVRKRVISTEDLAEM